MPNFHVLTGEPKAGPALRRKQAWRPDKYNHIVPSLGKYLKASRKVEKAVAKKEAGGVKAEGTTNRKIASHKGVVRKPAR